MQAVTKLVALGVAILPPPDVMARAIACSAALPRDGSERLVLDATHLPHITLTQHVIRYEELDGAYAEIDELLEGLLPLHLTITGGGQSGHTLWMAIERTPAPDGSTSSALSAIACPDPKTCYAVGAFERGSPTEHAFSLGWNGDGWTVVPMPDPSGPA